MSTTAAAAAIAVGITVTHCRKSFLFIKYGISHCMYAGRMPAIFAY
jgi:hypothetical protein